MRFIIFLPQLDSIAITNSPLPIIFVFFLVFSLETRDAHQSSPGIEKNSEASMRRFDLNLPVHTARIMDAFWPKLGRLFGISGEPSLLLNPSSSPVSPPATRRNSARFYRAMRRKEVTSSRDYSCTWSYLGGCRGWSTSVRCLICTVILRFWHFSLLSCFLLGDFNSVKLTLPVKFNIFGSMHLIRLISCAIFKAEA